MSTAAKKKLSKKKLSRKQDNKRVGKDVAKHYFMGIDLGASRSTMVGEDGTKVFMESVVGWPKDLISLKALEENILFGQDAIKMRDSLEISRPLVDGVLKEGLGRDKEAVEELLRHMIRQVDPPKGKKYAV
jgi:rod shape-determining protein MreB and related proteins